MPPRKHKDDDSSEEESEEEVSSDDQEGEDDGSSEEGSEEESTEEEEEQHQVVKKPAATTAPAQAASKAPAPSQASTAGTTVVANKPHDEEFLVDEAARRTPPEAKQRAAPAASGAEKQQPPAKSAPEAARQPAPSGGVGGGQKLENNPNDESFAVEDAGRRTPPQSKKAATPTTVVAPASTGGAPPAAGRPAPAPARTTQPVGKLQNDPNDEFEDVEDDVSSDDEKEAAAPPKKAVGPTGSQLLRNAQHDEAFDVGSASPSSNASSPGKRSTSPTSTPAKMAHGKTVPALAAAPAPAASVTGGLKPVAKHSPKTDAHAEDDEETGSDEDESSDEDNAPKMKGNVELPAAGAAQTQGLYNPQDYAFLNAKVSREVRDLFAHITSYQPTTVDCPTKLLPFIPSYIPCVGDIDAFCKVPRPDGAPDSLGLVVVDEPSCNQTNTAVEKMRWEYLTVGKVDRDSNVESVENAQNRPQIIDKWISDVKKLPKQLPTVTYSKPMPSIEQLMQIWPPEFEAVLNSDVQLPPPGIDLDIFQYVRVLCAILDIPTYSNLVESLHVMFTLYLEFRANQHFQHS